MGTRNLTCVFHNGDYRVAQYGQWDGYPSGQGATILNFLRDTFDRELFLTKLADTYQPNEQQIDGMNARLKAEKKDVSALYPSMTRDTGGEILSLIQTSAPGLPLRLQTDFAADSLFCEFAYVVDLDKGTFEVFRGFNQGGPLHETERFAFLNEKAGRGYHPVKLLAEFKLDALPTLEEFLAQLEQQDNDE